MSLATRKESSESIAPTVHLEFIQNQAGLPEGEGLQEIEAYHRSLFLHQHAGNFEQFKQQSRVHEDRLEHLQKRLGDTRAKLASLDRLIPVNLDGESDINPTSPWNMWDRAMFVAAGAGIAS